MSIKDRKCPSVATLETLKDVDTSLAKQIRSAWQTIGNRQQAREAVDRFFGTHGIEYLGWDKRSKEHVYYCNAGDVYAPTILFSGLRMWVGTMADLVEKGRIDDGQHQF